MSEEGYSTMMDAIVFLALVAVSAVILSQAITGHATERSMADRGLREISGDLLVSLDTEKEDFFEYRILGDMADRIANAGNLNASGDILYRGVTKLLLGRGNRHRTVMDIAAGDAACQFLAGKPAVRLNPVTAEYDNQVSSLIDRSVRSKLDSRYGYEFTLRWSPLAGVPFGGEVKSGKPRPAGAVSSSMPVTMPYTTSITIERLESINSPDLDIVGQRIGEYNADRDNDRLRHGIRLAIERCMRNTTGLIVDEILSGMPGSLMSGDSRLSPVSVLKRFSNNETLNNEVENIVNDTSRDIIADIAVVYGREDMDRLSETIAGGVIDGTVSKDSARNIILAWLRSRYEPSGGIASISVWVESHA